MLFSISCSQNEDFDESSKNLCECMKEKNSVQNGEYDLSRDLDYNNCILDLNLVSELDMRDRGFEKALEENCPDLLFLHDKYLESLEN